MSPGKMRVLLLILGSLVADSGDPCKKPTVLDQHWRSTNCYETQCTGRFKTDKHLREKWYRFNSTGGWKIPDKVIPQGRCSGWTSGWLKGPHPNMGEGEVTRTVCFTQGENNCQFRREIRVQNCSGYLVYRLKPTPGHHSVYCTDATFSDPCVTYTSLDQPWRQINFSHAECTSGNWNGDRNLRVGWYRFNSSSGQKIPEVVVSEGHCSKMIPGWLNGTHPSVGEGEVTRTVCFTQGENNCSQNQEIKVKNCSGYFVYRLKPTPWDHTVYCTAADSTLSDPCQTHTILDQPWRKMGCSKTKCTGGQWKFDSNLVDKWYRFSSSGAWKIPETAVCGHRCSGKKPGWLNGPHPNVGEGEVTRTVCFTVGEDTCHWKQEIRVKNCTRYFVYQLKPTPCCKYVYCTVIDSALSDPCETYIDLDQPWRSTNCSHTQCSDGQWMDDGNLEVGWYRFNSSGGRKIPETVVHGHRCSGENPGWLNGSHPSVGEQEVHRSVCFSSGENTCSWSLEIKVKNCPGYFVYWLKPTPANHTVYCTAADSAPGDLCVTHTILDQPWRSTICNNTECTSGEWMGDGNLTVGWYRFNSSSGQKIPEMTVRGHRCSGKKPGWLNGPHPGLGEGEVTRTVCFTDGDDTCDQSQEIRVKNCSGYFVYRLWPTPEADAVYCMTAESTLGDPCVTHTVLDQPWRSMNCSNTEHTDGQWKGDGNLEVGWYRFNSSGGWKIPETVVPQGHCSGDYSGWLNGPHPSVGEGEVTRTVCFTEGEDPCSWDQQIRVKNCTGYFVYRLWPTREADAVYCTDTAYCDPCVTHTVLDQPCRSTSCCSTSCTGGQWMDDGNLEVGWYRFNSSGGWKIPEMVVPPYHCSGEYPGWLNGPHPNVGEGEVTRTVCFTQAEYTCYWSQEIRMKNCSGYFVYRLWPTPSDNTVYCTDSGTSTGEQSEGSPTRDFSPAGDTTTGPGTSTGKQSGRSSTGDFSQETSSVPARDTASDPPNSKGSSRKPSSGPEKETCSVKGLLSKNECEEMINSAQVFIIGKNKLGNPEEREAYIRQVREMLMEQLPCKHVLSKSEHDNGGGN